MESRSVYCRVLEILRGCPEPIRTAHAGLTAGLRYAVAEQELLSPYLLARMVAQAAATSRTEYDANDAAASRQDMFIKACQMIPYLQMGNSSGKSAKDIEREAAAKKYKQYLLKVNGNGNK